MIRDPFQEAKEEAWKETFLPESIRNKFRSNIKTRLIKNCKPHPSIPWLGVGKVLQAYEINDCYALIQFQCVTGRIPNDKYEILRDE